MQNMQLATKSRNSRRVWEPEGVDRNIEVFPLGLTIANISHAPQGDDRRVVIILVGNVRVDAMCSSGCQVVPNDVCHTATPAGHAELRDTVQEGRDLSHGETLPALGNLVGTLLPATLAKPWWKMISSTDRPCR